MLIKNPDLSGPDNSIYNNQRIRPHIDHLYFITSKTRENKIINGVVHIDLISMLAYYECAVCSKLDIGIKYFNKPNKRVLVISDHCEEMYKYFQSPELHKSLITGNGALMASGSFVNDGYISLASYALKNNSNKTAISITAIPEESIPDTQYWRLINSKDLLIGANLT